MRLGLLCATVALAGCAPTLEELKSEPARFEIVVPAAWDKVGACLVAAYADDLQPRYVPVQSEQRAEITLYSPGGLAPPLTYASYDIRATGKDTKIVFRRRKLLTDRVDQDREKAERCGKA